jgi:hypothetical protein
MSLENKQGTIWSFNPAKSIGVIIDGQNKRWFFNTGRVIAGPAKVDVGLQVTFVIDTDQRPQAGRLPTAFQIEIIDNTAGQIALAEPSGKDTSEVR